MWFWMGSYLLIFLNGGAIVGGAGQSLQMALPGLFGEGGAKYWAMLVALVCAALLLSGRYAVLERISIGLVISFTLITVICTVLLQMTSYAITLDNLREGLTLGFPTPMTPVLVLLAMSMYANTGVTGNEMISYTYWCLEKGYARNAGACQEDEAWATRARGWIRVMYIDALLTMVVYTVSTVCFYLLGAAILHAKGLNPEGTATIATLGDAYTETLGGWAATLFVVGSFFVLFSTTFSNVAAHSRILTDGLGVMRLVHLNSYQDRLRCIRILVVVLLVAFVSAYSFFENPPMMLIVASLYTVVLYPVLGVGALYVRYRLIDRRVVAGHFSTGLLWVCGLALAIISPATLLLALLIRQGWLL
jgi:Mn2+/Fe2+ NRAMP family transporter